MSDSLSANEPLAVRDHQVRLQLGDRVQVLFKTASMLSGVVVRTDAESRRFCIRCSMNGVVRDLELDLDDPQVGIVEVRIVRSTRLRPRNSEDLQNLIERNRALNSGHYD